MSVCSLSEPMLASLRRTSTELVIAAGILGSLLVTPFVHLDDFVLLFPAAWLVLRASPSVWTAVFLGGHGAVLPRSWCRRSRLTAKLL